MRSTQLLISLTAIEENFLRIRAAVGSGVKVMAVVKADAYGHGLIPVARRLEGAGADMFAVAIFEEALALRDAGISRPILVLGGIVPADAGEAVQRDICAAVYDRDALAALSRAADAHRTFAGAHLKVDTGMSRIGVSGARALDTLLDAWRDCPRVRMEGMFSHFASADDDAAFTASQHAALLRAANAARAAGFAPVLHAAATCAIRNPALRHGMVRPGIALYGYQLPEVPGLRMAQRLTARPMRVDVIERGETVSYGRTFTAPRATRVMTLPIGYGDGYPRILGNRADVLVRGRRAPIIGRVCMDMLMADVTDIPGAAMGDEVVLLGEQGADIITADELARHAETIPYEIMLGFSPRVRRIWQD